MGLFLLFPTRLPLHSCSWWSRTYTLFSSICEMIIRSHVWCIVYLIEIIIFKISGHNEIMILTLTKYRAFFNEWAMQSTFTFSMCVIIGSEKLKLMLTFRLLYFDFHLHTFNFITWCNRRLIQDQNCCYARATHAIFSALVCLHYYLSWNRWYEICVLSWNKWEQSCADQANITALHGAHRTQ